jgi:hypothetical protein
MSGARSTRTVQSSLPTRWWTGASSSEPTPCSSEPTPCSSEPTPCSSIPGSPWQNAWIESFNGRIRDEIRNGHRFDSPFEAQVPAEDWRIDYNLNRSHSAHGWLTPVEFVERNQEDPQRPMQASIGWPLRRSPFPAAVFDPTRRAPPRVLRLTPLVELSTKRASTRRARPGR